MRRQRAKSKEMVLTALYLNHAGEFVRMNDPENEMMDMVDFIDMYMEDKNFLRAYRIYANPKHSHVHMFCNVKDRRKGFCGGNIIFHVQNLDELYWEQFASKKQRDMSLYYGSSNGKKFMG